MKSVVRDRNIELDLARVGTTVSLNVFGELFDLVPDDRAGTGSRQLPSAKTDLLL